MVDVSAVRLATVVLAGLPVGSTLACQGDEQASATTEGPPTTAAATTTTAEPTTTTALVSEDAVLAGNQAAWEAFFTAFIERTGEATLTVTQGEAVVQE
jgi:hypothetical protein